MSRKNKIEYVATLDDQTSKKLETITEGMVKMDKSMVKVAETLEKKTNKELKKSSELLGGFKSAIKSLLVGAGIVSLIRGVVDTSIAFEKVNRSLKVATGSAEGAKTEFHFVAQQATRLGLDLQSTAVSYAKLAAAARGTVLEGEDTRQIFLGISEAARVLGLSSEETKGALVAIEQIISKGKVSAEELRGQLGERLPGAFNLAARSMGVTTARLSKMLELGEITAREMLPKLAAELRKTYGGEIESAANDTVATMNRFKTAIQNLQLEIAQGGILEGLTTLLGLLTATTQGMSAAFFNASPFVFDKEIADANDQLSLLIRQRADIMSTGITGELPQLTAINEEIKAVEKLIATLVTKQKVEFGMLTGRKSVMPAKRSILRSDEDLDKAMQADQDRIDEAMKNIVRSYETAEQEVTRRLGELKLVEHLLPPDEVARITGEIRDILTDGIDEITIRTKRKFRDSKPAFDAYTEFATQAARDIQSAFADFLFDPFEDGVRGMLNGFLIAIRKMMAAAVASQILSVIPGLSSFLPKRHAGGPVTAGQPVLVRPDEEVFVPHNSGRVVRSGSGGGGGGVTMSFNTSIDARGADPGLIARFPQIMDERDARLMLKVKEYVSNGGITL